MYAGKKIFSLRNGFSLNTDLTCASSLGKVRKKWPRNGRESQGIKIELTAANPGQVIAICLMLPVNCMLLARHGLGTCFPGALELLDKLYQAIIKQVLNICQLLDHCLSDALCCLASNYQAFGKQVPSRQLTGRIKHITTCVLYNYHNCSLGNILAEFHPCALWPMRREHKLD